MLLDLLVKPSKYGITVELTAILVTALAMKSEGYYLSLIKFQNLFLSISRDGFLLRI